jgi:hypothetical protein
MWLFYWKKRIVVELAMGRKRPDNGRGRDKYVFLNVVILSVANIFF